MDLAPTVRQATAACYLRVSSEAQTVENQRAEVERLAIARGFEPVVYAETGSAAKARPVFERLRADVLAGRHGAVCVWALDRLGRSLAGVVGDVTAFEACGAPVLSVRDNWLNQSGPARGLLLSVFAWVAEYERLRLVERTQAGLARARRAGRRLGRPPRSPIMVGAAVDAVEAGASIRSAAESLGLPKSVVARAVAARRRARGVAPLPGDPPRPKNPGAGPEAAS